MKFMADDRALEVHERGSNRSVGQEGVKFGIGTHHVDGGIVTIAGPPGMEPAVGYRPTYSFTIDGTDRKVTETCAVHLALLQRMVAEFSSSTIGHDLARSRVARIAKNLRSNLSSELPICYLAKKTRHRREPVLHNRTGGQLWRSHLR
jgi:hypothetical protein